MRIIGGEHKGRLIRAPKNMRVRPTTDQAKEGLFNILNNYFDFEGLEVLDLFAGTGNIAYEFVSRGASQVVAIEQNFACFRFIRKTAKDLDLENLKVQKTNVFRYLNYAYQDFDIIFADPPYDMRELEQIPELVFENNWLKAGGWLIIEHDKSHDFSNHLYFIQHRLYGKVNFSIFGKTQ